MNVSGSGSHGCGRAKRRSGVSSMGVGEGTSGTSLDVPSFTLKI